MKSCAGCHEKCLLCETLLCSCHPTHQLRPLQGSIHKKTYKPKEILFHEGDPANRLFLLSSGYVKLSTALPDGRNQGLRLGMARQFIGFEGLNETCYSYTAEAVTPVEVCSLPYKDMLRIMEQNAHLAIAVVDALNRELQRSNAVIRNLGLLNSTERVASLLLSLLPPPVHCQDIPLPLTRTDMAEMLGLTLETVSRVLSRMSREDIIHLPPNGRQMRIIDRARLAALTGGATAPLAYAVGA